MNSKIWNRIVLLGMLLLLGACAAITVVIDPFFQYHGPLATLGYPLEDERYQNDGIIEFFDYDAIITGSSMCENFSTTQFDSIWGTKSIKVAFAGGSYKEIDENLNKALRLNDNVKYVLRSIDYSSMMSDKDDMLSIGAPRPTYLYDNNIFNDVSYLFNKEVLLDTDATVVGYTLGGGKTTSFDQYANWSDDFEYGREAILYDYERPARCEEQPLNGMQLKTMRDNISQNIIATVNEYPDVTFYLFFTPYSIMYWDMIYQNGTLNARIEAEKCAIEMLLECPNVKLYSFCTNFEMVCDLNNYKDQAHFGEWINSKILSWMSVDDYLLTKDNYEAYIDSIRDFYTSYDYDSLY